MKTILTFCLLSIFICSTSHNALAQLIRTVALSGTPAPGLPDGISFNAGNSAFQDPVINNAGQVAFGAEATGNGINDTNSFGIWSEGSGGLSIVARTGDAAPGLPTGAVFEAFLDSYTLNSNGQLAFASFAGQRGVGIWNEEFGSLQLEAYGGFAGPLTPPSGQIFRSIERPLINSSGHLAGQAEVTGVGEDTAVWSTASGSLQLVAREGTSAPGIHGGAQFAEIGFPVLNESGETAFRALLAGQGVNGTNTDTIWLGDASSLDVIVRGGDLAPGTGEGIAPRDVTDANRFAGFRDPVINSASLVAFRATLEDSCVIDVTEECRDEGIWSGIPGSLSLIARNNTEAPEIGNDFLFNTFEDPLLNVSGHVAFTATAKANDVEKHGIWVKRSGVLELVAYSGEQAPGTPSGVEFSSFNKISINTSIQTIRLNASGQIAFVGSLEGNGIDQFNDKGIWAEDRDSNLQLLAREGDYLEVAPGDFRRVFSISVNDIISGNDDGRPSAFNDSGQFVFRARFYDGTAGIFVSNIAAIPEPHSLVYISMFAITCILFNRSRARLQQNSNHIEA